MAGRSNSSLWAIVITVIALTTFEKEARYAKALHLLRSL